MTFVLYAGEFPRGAASGRAQSGESYNSESVFARNSSNCTVFGRAFYGGRIYTLSDLRCLGVRYPPYGSSALENCAICDISGNF